MHGKKETLVNSIIFFLLLKIINNLVKTVLFPGAQANDFSTPDIICVLGAVDDAKKAQELQPGMALAFLRTG